MADGEGTVPAEVTDPQSGFSGRLRDGGFRRITERSDLYAALFVTSILFLVDSHTGFTTLSAEVVSDATTVAAALSVGLVAALAGLVLLAGDRARADDREAYAALLVRSELAVYLALLTSASGAFVGAYADALYDRGLYTVVFFGFVFAFLYAVLAAATLVSDLVAYGERGIERS